MFFKNVKHFCSFFHILNIFLEIFKAVFSRFFAKNNSKSQFYFNNVFAPSHFDSKFDKS